MEIRVLARQGMSIRAIAQQLRVSRNTVRKYLRQTSLPHYSSRAARPTKLDPFKPYLQERIQAAQPHWIPATVLMREILARGYSGGISQLKAWLAPLRGDTPEPVVRFETAPGQQMQVDFTIIRRGRQPLKAFVATLGFSRASYVHFFDHERSEAWLTGLREACHFFGGVPQEVLFDNASTIILARDAYGEGAHRWHPALLALRPTATHGLPAYLAAGGRSIRGWLDTLRVTRVHFSGCFPNLNTPQALAAWQEPTAGS